MDKPLRDFRVVSYAGYDVLVGQTERGKRLLQVAFVEPEYKTQPPIIPAMVILHSHASGRGITWRDALRFWSKPENVGEAHFSIQMDGVVAQTMPLNRRADCNYKANSWPSGGPVRYGAIAIETQDEGAATVNEVPWTAEQIESIAQVCAAVAVRYPECGCGVPVHAFDRRTIGCHADFADWSSYRGKTCPGTQRRRQAPWVRNRVADLVVNYRDEA